jgi:predicted amidohydrolase YtcJ
MKIQIFILSIMIFVSCSGTSDYSPDLIIVNGKILTVDKNFSVAEALAIKNDKFIAIGSNTEITKLAENSTKRLDLKGKTVIPGLIDAHLHPETASVSELTEEIPDVHTINELLNWIRDQTSQKKKGEWIIHPKFFPTRLQEMRQPTLEELDLIAPNNPVFLDGSYGGMINSAAMRISNITSVSKNHGILKNEVTGQPTGFIRASAFHLLKKPPEPSLTYEENLDALEDMIRRYNSVGFTGLCSGAGNPGNLKKYFDLKKRGRLTARILQNMSLPLDTGESAEEIRKELLGLGYYTGFGDEWVRIGALKVWMDGGILTGTAWLREPWGEKAKEIYGITDPTYRGVLITNKATLLKIGKVANEIGWKFTAHCTGGGGVDVMLDAFEEINKSRSIKAQRFSIIHGNFFTPDAIDRMKNLGVYADMQPAWFYKDSDAIKYVLGERRIKSFHPYKSLFESSVIVNGGSDHMVKYDSYSSINPYNPFLAMWSVITRTSERGSIIVSEEAISREQALRMYTINNAYASFEENLKGSIEPGKLADLVVITEDFLDCPVEKIKSIEAEMTMVGGEIVYRSDSFQFD